MAYLNVIPDPAPVPAVRGLGRLGQVRLIVPPGLSIPAGTTPIQLGRAIRSRARGVRGLGQTGCPGSLDAAMQSWLSSLSAELPVDAAVGCGSSGGANCSSPSEAAGMAVTIAQQFCDLASSVAGEFPNCTVDPGCANPAAAAAPYQAQALSLFNSFPASVWSTEAANAASGQTYGAVGTEQGPSSSTAGETLVNLNGSIVAIPAGMALPAGATVVSNGGVTIGNQAAAQQQSSSGSGSSGSTGGSSSVGVTATITNASAPGQPFQAGDNYDLTITGPSNQTVEALASQNGAPMSGPTTFGTTDASGTFHLSGTFSSQDVGSWTEVWAVQGTNQGATIEFTVSALTNQTPNGSGSGAGSGSSSSSSGGSSNTTPAATSSLDLSWLSSEVNLFGVSIPVWGLLAAGAGLLILMPKKL